MLRVKDLDFARGQITVRDPKWKRERMTMLPAVTVAALQEQLAEARLVHQSDLAAGFGAVWLPEAFKFPGAARDWRWQWVFPATSRWRDPEGQEGRHHLHETVIQRAVHRAVTDAGIQRRVSCQTFRHSFATLSSSVATTSARCRACPERSRRELLGHRDVSTTMIYTHVLRHGAHGVRSPLDP